LQEQQGGKALIFGQISISRDLVDKGANIAVSQHLVEALDDQADLSKMETYDGIGKVDVS
jgi:hypothetical protein